MRKIALMIMFVVMLVFSVVSVEGVLKTGARTAGYHSMLYTDAIQSADDIYNYVSIYPQALIVGTSTAGRLLSISGDAGGNYVFDSLFAGSRISFFDPVNMNSVLTVSNNVNAVRFCDVNGLNCFTGSLVNGLYTNVSNLQSLTSGMYANISSLQAFRNGVYANVSNLQTFTSNLNLLPAACAAAGQVLTWNGVDWICQNAPGGSVPSCANGQILVWNSVSSSWVCQLPSISPSLTCAVAGQVLTWNGASWVCQNAPGGSVPSCANGQILVWNSVSSSWVCQLPSISPSLTCAVAGQVLTWNGASWVCQAPSGGGANYWTLSGSNIYSNVAGNVGIGTSAPAQKLDVTGNARVSGSVTSTSVSTSVVAVSTQVNSAKYCDENGANCYDFVIDSRGLCYTAPAVCKIESTFCGVTNPKFYDLPSPMQCDDFTLAEQQAMCLTFCSEDVAYPCDGRSPYCSGGGIAYWSDSMTSALCEGGNEIWCNCRASMYYNKATYTDPGIRCI
jgi:hypothetical protein